MNKQRKVLITTTYNEMGIIIDTKAEEVEQPEKRTEERTETHACDSISRQAALGIAFKYCPDDDGTCSEAGTDLRDMIDELENLPSTQPEIIRCKDCKHFKQVFAPNDNDGLCRHWHSKCDARTNRNGYCSHAERKQNDTERC